MVSYKDGVPPPRPARTTWWEQRERSLGRNAQRDIERAQDELRSEVRLAWTRTTYMGTFQGFLIAALSLLLAGANSHESEIQFFAVFLCITGLFVTGTWILTNYGSQGWQEYREALLQKKGDASGYSGQRSDSKRTSSTPPPFSISRTNIRLSWFFGWFWCCAAILLTIRHLVHLDVINLTADDYVTAYVLLLIFTVIGMLVGFLGLKTRVAQDGDGD